MENLSTDNALFFAPHKECPQICDISDTEDFLKQKTICEERQYNLIQSQIQDSSLNWDGATFLNDFTLAGDMDNSTSLPPQPEFITLPQLLTSSNNPLVGGDPLASSSSSRAYLDSLQVQPISPAAPQSNESLPFNQFPIESSAENPWLATDETTTFCKNLLMGAGVVENPHESLTKETPPVDSPDFILEVDDIVSNAAQSAGIASNSAGSDASTPRSSLTLSERRTYSAIAKEVENLMDAEGAEG